VTLKLCFVCILFFVQNIALDFRLNCLNAKLNPICHLLALLGAYHILHISRIRVKADLIIIIIIIIIIFINCNWVVTWWQW